MEFGNTIAPKEGWTQKTKCESRNYTLSEQLQCEPPCPWVWQRFFKCDTEITYEKKIHTLDFIKIKTFVLQRTLQEYDFLKRKLLTEREKMTTNHLFLLSGVTDLKKNLYLKYVRTLTAQ